jgi:hypothetical protein
MIRKKNYQFFCFMLEVESLNINGGETTSRPSASQQSNGEKEEYFPLKVNLLSIICFEFSN